MQCIYCKKGKGKKEFDREHVLPELLGKFKNNFVLHNKVCKECNSYFGNNLEVIVGRESFESYLRYSYGIKKFNKHPTNRIIIKCRIDGDFKGALMEIILFDKEKDTWHGDLLPQVAFIDAAGEKHHFVKGNIPKIQDLKDKGIEIKGIHLIGKEEFIDDLIGELGNNGIDFQKKGSQSFPQNYDNPTTVLVKIRAQIDDINLRFMAKIAFNYLAFSQPANFVLNDSFDLIRNYIRHGSDIPDRLITIDRNPLLQGESSNHSFTNGHLLTIEWRGGPIIAKVRPFNHVTYRIILCNSFGGIYRSIKIGHHFDIKSKTISKLQGIRHIVLPH